jgi:hypothetical protein
MHIGWSIPLPGPFRVSGTIGGSSRRRPASKSSGGDGHVEWTTGEALCITAAGWLFSWFVAIPIVRWCWTTPWDERDVMLTFTALLWIPSALVVLISACSLIGFVVAGIHWLVNRRSPKPERPAKGYTRELQIERLMADEMRKRS